jgi:hypothetical protein
MSCGGGTTTSKSRNSVVLKMDFENYKNSGRNGSSGFMVGNTLVTAVTISYSTSGGSSEEVDATDAAENGTAVEIGDLIAGKTYSFMISANGENNEVVCTGSTDIEIVPNSETEAELTCTFGGVASMELAALNMLKTAYAGGATYADIEKYVADDFGVMDGMDRDAFINMITGESTGFIFNNDVTLSGVVLTSVSARQKRDSQEGGLFDIKLSYSDGSYEYDTVGFAYENGDWKIKGNGLLHDVDVRNTSVRMYQYPSQTVPYVISGVSFNYNFDDNPGFNNFSVSGQGISTSAFSLTMASNAWYGLNVSNNKMAIEYGSLPYYFSQPSYNIIPYNGFPMVMYEPITAQYANSTEEVYTVRGGNLSTEQYSDMFPRLRMRQYEDSEGPHLEFIIDAPTSYTPSGMKLELDANNGMTGYRIDTKIALNEPSFTLEDAAGMLNYAASYFVVALTATDSNMRDYTVYYTYDYLFAEELDGTLGSKVVSGNFKGFGTGGFYSYMENLFGIDNNQYGAYSDPVSGISDGDSLYTVSMLQGAGKVSQTGLGKIPYITKLTKDSAPLVKKINFANFSDGTEPSYKKMIQDLSGNIYLISDYMAASSFVTVMKIKSDYSEIEWFKKYTINGSPTDTVGGVIINQIGTEYLVLTLRDIGQNKLFLTKLSTASGSHVSTMELSFTDNQMSGMPFTPYGIVNIAAGGKIALVGVSNGSSFYYGAAVYDYDLNVSGGFFRTGNEVDILPLGDIQADSNGNIYFKYLFYDNTEVKYFVRVMKLLGEVNGIGYSIDSCSFVQFNTEPQFNASNGFTYDGSLAVSYDGKAYVLIGMNQAFSYDVLSQQNDHMVFKLDSSLANTKLVRVPALGTTSAMVATGSDATVIGSRIANLTTDLQIAGVSIEEYTPAGEVSTASVLSVSAMNYFTVTSAPAGPDIFDIKDNTGVSLISVGTKLFNYELD